MRWFPILGPAGLMLDLAEQQRRRADAYQSQIADRAKRQAPRELSHECADHKQHLEDKAGWRCSECGIEYSYTERASK